MSLTVEQLIKGPGGASPIRTPNARKHARRARSRYDGHLTVVRLNRGDMASWTVCSVPDCRSHRDGQGKDYGFRAATVEFLVAGWSLGCFCDKHAREVRGVYAEFAPAEEWTSWMTALNAKVARKCDPEDEDEPDGSDVEIPGPWTL